MKTIELGPPLTKARAMAQVLPVPDGWIVLVNAVIPPDINDGYLPDAPLGAVLVCRREFRAVVTGMLNTRLAAPEQLEALADAFALETFGDGGVDHCNIALVESVGGVRWSGEEYWNE